MILELKPSDILYSQDSISKQFSCGIRYIGDTLDQLLIDSSYIQRIPNIQVVERNGTLFSMDNRRLWVFKKAEEFGCFEKIAVIRTRKFNRNKFTTKNGGTSIRVRGDPGGNIWKTWSPVHIRDKHDYDDLNKSSLRVQGPHVRTNSRYKTNTMVTSGNNGGHEDGTRNAFYTSYRYRTTETLLEDTDNRNNTLRSPDTDSYVHRSLKGTSYSKCVDKAMDKTCNFTCTSKFSRKVMDNEISGSSSAGTGDGSRNLNYDSGSRGDHGGEIQKTRSPVNTRDKHDDNLNRSSLRVQGPPVSTYNRYKTNTIVTSGKNDRNEDNTSNAFYTSSRYRITEHLFEDIDDRNTTLRSPDTDSYVHGSLKGTSYSKCVDEVMDKTRSYVWEDSRKGMENEISGSSIPVTGTRSRDLYSDSGSRGDHGGETQITCSPVNTRDKHDDNLNRSSLRVQGPPVSTYNIYKTNTIVTSGKNDRNEDNTRNAFYTSYRYRTAKPLLEDTNNRNNTLISPDTDLYVHGRLDCSSNSKCVEERMDKARSFPRTSKYSRKVMENETSGSFSSVTGAESRNLNSGSGSRGDHGGEIQKTWSPMYIKDKHDYDDLNKSSLRVHGPPGSTISRYKTNTMVTSGYNGGNEDDTRNAFYTSSRYRTTETLLEDTDNRNNTLRSPDTDSYVHRSLKGTSYSKCVDEAMDKTRSFPRTRKIMENETSGSSLFVTGAGSRDLNSNSGFRGNHEGEIQKTRPPVHERDIHDGNLNKSSIRVQGLHVSRITRHVSNTLRSPDTNSYVHGNLKGSSNSKCVDESLDKTRYFTHTDSKQLVENKTSGSFTPVTDSISLVLNSDSGSSSAYNQLKLDMIKKMQRAKACLINSDKNECGTSLQRSSAHRPSNQTHERKTNVFERYTF